MFGKIRKLLLFSDFSRSDLNAVKPLIIEENRKFCIIWSIVHDLFWVYCLVMSMINPLYHQCRDIYGIAFVFCTASLFLSVFFAPNHKWATPLIMILLDAVLLLSGVFIARNLAPKTIVVFAAVLIVPVSFITDTFFAIALLLINAVLFSLIGPGGMDPDTYRWVLSNMIIFSVIGIMLGHFVNRARYERYIFADSSAKLAERESRHAHYDQLTDMQNRRAYEETLGQLSREQPSSCLVVIADINGLKQTNDAYGHDAGDELIVGAAECLRQSFPGEEHLYRIGGDEFCVIIPDAKCDAGQCLRQLQERCAKWEGKFIHGISISAGYASSEEFTDLNAMLKAADKRMYEAKKHYYETSGIDRRRR